MKLETKHILEYEPNALPIHKHLSDLRNDYVAHAGVHGQEITVVIVALNPDTHEKSVRGVGFNQIASMGPNPQERNEFIEISKGLLNVLQKMRKKTEGKLLMEYRTKDIEELYKNAISQ